MFFFSFQFSLGVVVPGVGTVLWLVFDGVGSVWAACLQDPSCFLLRLPLVADVDHYAGGGDAVPADSH